MSEPVSTGPVPSQVETPELASYVETLRQDALALERRLLDEIALRERLERRVAQLEE